MFVTASSIGNFSLCFPERDAHESGHLARCIGSQIAKGFFRNDARTTEIPASSIRCGSACRAAL